MTSIKVTLSSVYRVSRLTKSQNTYFNAREIKELILYIGKDTVIKCGDRFLINDDVWNVEKISEDTGG